MWSYLLVAAELVLFVATLYLFFATRELYRHFQAPLAEAPDAAPLRNEVAALIYQLEETAGEIEASLTERSQELKALLSQAKLEQPKSAPPPGPAATTPPPAKKAPEDGGSIRYLRIPTLYAQGLKTPEIARDLHLGQEEVELALELMGGGRATPSAHQSQDSLRENVRGVN